MRRKNIQQNGVAKTKPQNTSLHDFVPKVFRRSPTSSGIHDVVPLRVSRVETPWNSSASTSENEWESKGTHIKYMKYEEFKTALTDISAITAYTRVTYPIMWPKSKYFTGSGTERVFWAEKRSKFPALNRIYDRDEFSRPIRCSARNLWSGNHPSEQKAFLTCRLVLTCFCKLMSALAAIN